MLSLLRGFILDYKKPLAAGARVFAYASDRGAQAFARGRLGDKGEGSMREAVMPVLVHSQHLDRNVTRRGILLQVVQNGPAEHVGKRDIERDCGGVELPRQRERLGTSERYQDFEALFSR